MGKGAATVLGAIIGGFAAGTAVVLWLGWGVAGYGQTSHADPTRSDYVDLLLTLITVLLSAVGVGITVGAVVIGVVALKTLREIKDEAATSATSAAAVRITETIDAELGPSVNAEVGVALPQAIHTALLDDELGHKILTEMAKRGDLDEVLERVAMRMQGGGPETDPDDSAPHWADEGETN